MNRYKSIITTILYCSILLTLSVICWFKEPNKSSDAERRPLAQAPLLNIDTVLSGDFMKSFEEYATDQFPFRDFFRSLKAHSAYGIFHQLDNNDIYVVENNISKIEYPLNEVMLENASAKFKSIYDQYMSNKNVNLYFSIVPDKNYFIAQQNGYLSLNYDELVGVMREKTDYMQYIDLFDKLKLSDYYRTDTHWKQESIVDVANHICTSMGTNCSTKYDVKTVLNENSSAKDFKGVYHGQSALSIKPDEINYLMSETLDGCDLYSYSSGKKQKIELYNFEKTQGKDPYEMFLNGSEALLVIENPNSKTDRELVVFRDSFGSSLIPLMTEGYSKITAIDIRYMDSNMIGKFVEFNNQDVLFIYSTLVLNNSMSLR